MRQLATACRAGPSRKDPTNHDNLNRRLMVEDRRLEQTSPVHNNSLRRRDRRTGYSQCGMNGDKTPAPYPETYPRGPGQPATSSQRAVCISVVGSRKKDTPSLGSRAVILIPSGRRFTLAGRTVPSLRLLCRHRGKGISRHCGGSISRVCMCVLAKAGALVPASMEHQISSGRRPCVCSSKSCILCKTRLVYLLPAPLLCPALDDQRKGAWLAKRAETQPGEDAPWPHLHRTRPSAPDAPESDSGCRTGTSGSGTKSCTNYVRLPIGRIWVIAALPGNHETPRDEASG